MSFHHRGERIVPVARMTGGTSIKNNVVGALACQLPWVLAPRPLTDQHAPAHKPPGVSDVAELRSLRSTSYSALCVASNLQGGRSVLGARERASVAWLCKTLYHALVR